MANEPWLTAPHGDAMRGLLRVVRTVRHLRWEQVAYRAVRRLQPVAPASRRVDARWDPAAASAIAAPLRAWLAADPDAPLARARADEVLDGTFRFIGHAEHLPAPDWRGRLVSHLWTFNLHYFDYAFDLARAWVATGDGRYVRRFEELARSWVAATASRRGDAWHPYPTSLRIVNWAYAIALFGDALAADARAQLVASLAQQLRALSRRLEFHILANHLQKNAFALYVGAHLFAGRDAERWRAAGARYLWRELFEQVLADGGHYERSPMYHAIALGDFLQAVLVADATGAPVPPAARDRVRAMVAAMACLSRPDGTLHRFNDAADGIAPTRASLDALARLVVDASIPDAPRAWALADSGFYGWNDAARGERLVVDCGPPGPSYQPGHAHCDLLSYELDLAGRPVVVDSGVGGYDDALRDYVRSTRAHNTVAIAGREQSEVWGSFRVGGRARVLEARQQADGDHSFSGAYAPHHMPGAVHRRTITREADGWRVTDRVSGAGDAPLESFVHLHPDFACEVVDGVGVARADTLRILVEPIGRAATLDVVRGARAPAQGWYCPQFGVRLAAPVFRLRTGAANGAPFGYRIRRSG